MEPYKSAESVMQAIKQKAVEQAARPGERKTVTELMRVYLLGRFVNHIFTTEVADRWIVKGGAGLLARVPSARMTTDIDLACAQDDFESEVEAFIDAVEGESSDHLTYTFIESVELSIGEQQQKMRGARLFFAVNAGSKRGERIHMDLVSKLNLTTDVETLTPIPALEINRLPHNQITIYPIEEHTSDKVCATVFGRSGRESSRVKDLVDLVIIAETQTLEADTLRVAITAQCERTGKTFPEQFTTPASWEGRYQVLAAKVPHCDNYPDAKTATDFIKAFIDPVLAGEVQGKVWNPQQKQWTQPQPANAVIPHPSQAATSTPASYSVSETQRYMQQGYLQPGDGRPGMNI